MSIFKDAAQVEEIYGAIWTDLILNKGLGEKLKNAGITVLYKISDPDADMYIDETGPKFGDEAHKNKPVVTMKMSSETVHKFWLKKVNVPKAIALGQIKAKGPIPKVLRLLPLLKPAQEEYPEYCEKYNLPMD